MFLRIHGKVVHERIVGIRSWSVAIGRERRVFKVFALSHIAVGLPLHSGLERALDIVPALYPVVFERGRKVKLLRIYDLVGEICLRKHRRQVVALGLRVDCRLV